MTGEVPRKILVQCRSAPYCSSRARDAVDVAMACAAFDQQVTLLYIGDGVLGLLANQQPANDLGRSLEKLLGALRDYGLEQVHVEQEALTERGIRDGDLSIPIRRITRAELAGLYAAHDVVLTV
jgi:tRNA 2-thiouridine synthesizing protein C